MEYKLNQNSTDFLQLKILKLKQQHPTRPNHLITTANTTTRQLPVRLLTGAESGSFVKLITATRTIFFSITADWQI